MEQRILTGTELTVSRLCMGAMTFGGQTDETQARRMTDYCLDRGINFFDTANIYTGGRSEEITGRCLGTKRKDVVLASKVRGAMGSPVEYEGLSAAAIRRGLEETLRRLGTDYLDIYYLHQPDQATPIEESLATMEALRQEGKIRYVGTSNYSSWQVGEMFGISKEKGYPPPAVSQPMYSLLARGIEQEYVAFCKRFKVAMVVYNPLAAGLLTGKQSFQQGPISGTRFDGNKMYLDRYWHPAYFEAVEAVRAVSTKHGRPMIELALRWLLDRDAVDAVLLGASKFEHLEANIAATETAPLSDEINAELDEVWNNLRGPTPFYNR